MADDGVRYCHSCDSEFVAGVEVCAACGLETTTTAPPPKPAKGRRSTAVRSPRLQRSEGDDELVAYDVSSVGLNERRLVVGFLRDKDVLFELIDHILTVGSSDELATDEVLAEAAVLMDGVDDEPVLDRIDPNLMQGHVVAPTIPLLQFSPDEDLVRIDTAPLEPVELERILDVLDDRGVRHDGEPGELIVSASDASFVMAVVQEVSGLGPSDDGFDGSLPSFDVEPRARTRGTLLRRYGASLIDALVAYGLFLLVRLFVDRYEGFARLHDWNAIGFRARYVAGPVCDL